MTDTAKQNILITGCSGGFGRLTAETLAKDGHRVFATMREIQGKNAEAAGELRAWSQQEDVSVEVVELDVSEDASVEHAVGHILDCAGRVDVVVNNAGFVALGALEAFTLEQIQTLFDVNTLGPLRVNRAVLPSMRENQSGLIIHISSGSGRFYMPFLGAYCASKFALEAFAEAYGFELALFGIDAIVVEPGGHRTGIQQKILEPADHERVAAYAPFKQDIQDKMIATIRAQYDGPDPPKAQDVADTVKRLVDMPAGQRPFRTVVGNVATAGVEQLNQAYDQHKKTLLKSMGVSVET